MIKKIVFTGLTYMGASAISRSYNPTDWSVLLIVFSIMVICAIWDDKE